MLQYDRGAWCGLACSLWLFACGPSVVKAPVLPPADVDNPGGALALPAIAGAGGGIVTNPNRCVEASAGATRVTPRVILVLDGSCSMSTNYPANGAASATSCVDNPMGRWAALRRALVDPQTGVVTKLQGIVQFGVVVFGTKPVCPIPGDPVAPALNNLAQIESKVGTVQPGMNTPTGPALDWVYENQIQPDNPDDANGPQIVILATDGEPNSCGSGGRAQTNYQPSIDALKRGTAKGVKTYVISLADSAGAFHDHLQELANLGDPSANGAAKLYEPSSPAELTAALQGLVGSALSCEIALSGTITDGSECKGTVMLNGSPIACNSADGWKLLDPRHIQLQGDACKQLMEKNAMVEARFPCSGFNPD
jgi:hypothetical protein